MSTLPLSTPDPLPLPAQPTLPEHVGTAPISGGTPPQRRQPLTTRRSVVPVEWFRRMPGGGTVYSPGDESPADTDS